MSFRVTPQITLNNAIKNSQRHTSELAKLQQQASTGLRIDKPSDDPLATRAILSHRSLISRLDTQIANIEQTRGTLNSSVSNLLEANRLLVRAKEIALGSDDSDAREILALEIDNILDQLRSVGNAQFGDRYLFSGDDSGTQPFTEATAADGSRSVAYNGSTRIAEAPIGSDEIDVLLVGADVFGGEARQTPLYFGDTGAQPGSGVDSATGVGALTVEHIATTYGGASGITAGASSAAGDTIIGPAGAHTLTITGSDTISLNGGPAVSFDRTETDLEIIGPGGERVFVNTTAIPVAFAGTVDITATGAISTDGGVTEQTIDFSANQVVTHGGNGTVTHVNTTDIRRAGEESIEYVGASNVFQALAQLRDDLRNTRGLSSAQLTKAFERRIADIDRVRDHISTVIAQQSASLENLDALQARAEDLKLETNSSISDLESADIAEVALRLQNTQALLQFTLSATARIFDTSILDFLG